MEILTALSWWVLVQFCCASGNDLSRHVPRALGPYPSRELCRVAARAVMPEDRQFWPVAERRAQERKDQEERERAKAQRDAERKTKKPDKNGWIYFTDGTMIHYDEDGKEDGWGGSTTSGPYYDWQLPPTALSGCVSIPDPPGVNIRE